MSKTEKIEADYAKKNAARTLLKQYIADNPEKIMYAIENIIPFFNECSLSALQEAMTTVNVTFASVALKVIEDVAEYGDDSTERSFLPVDASEMQTAVYYLTKFIRLLGPLAAICENDNIPAIKMTDDAFSKIMHA